MEFKLSRFFQKNNKSIYVLNLSIVVLGIFISRYPLFKLAPIPFIVNDTIQYEQVVMQITHGEWPVFSFLPPGYPLFLYFNYLVSNTNFVILLSQHLFTFFSFAFACFIFTRYNQKYWLIISGILFFYLIDGMHIFLDSSLMPDSLYKNFLVLFAAVLYWAFKENEKYIWIVLSVLVFFPAIMRSNGPFIYIFIPVIVFYFYKLKMDRGFYYALLVPMFLLNLGWATYNYAVDEVFFIGNYERIKRVYERESSGNNPDQRTDKKPKKSKLLFFKTLMFYPAVEGNPIYYNGFVEGRCEFEPTSNNIAVYTDGGNVTELRKLVYKELLGDSNNNPCISVNKELFDMSEAQHFGIVKRYIYYFQHSNMYLFVYQIFQKIGSLIFRNFVVLIGMYLLVAYSIIRCIKNQFAMGFHLYIVLLFLLHLFSVLSVVIAHNLSISAQRYALATEFTHYFILILYMPKLIEYVRVRFKKA